MPKWPRDYTRKLRLTRFYVARRRDGEPLAHGAYDEDTQRTLFTNLATTYNAWNGTTLSPLPMNVLPPNRLGGAWSIRPPGGVAILQGGAQASTYDHTWLWNGVAWRELATGASRPTRFGHKIERNVSHSSESDTTTNEFSAMSRDSLRKSRNMSCGAFNPA